MLSHPKPKNTWGVYFTRWSTFPGTFYKEKALLTPLSKG